jgi:predicted nucleotidyltransferase
VFGLLLGQPVRGFCASELIALARIGSGAVLRELARLLPSGLVTVRPVASQRPCQANPDAPLFAELCGSVLKTVGLADPLRELLRPLARQIDAAFVFGSVAKRQDAAASDIGLMVISDSLSYGDIVAALEAGEARLGRPVNPTILSRQDLARRVAEDSAFVTRVSSRDGGCIDRSLCITTHAAHECGETCAGWLPRDGE